MTKKLCRTPLLSLILFLSLPLVALGGPRFSVLSGYEVDSSDQSYGYIGLMTMWSYFLVRAWADEVRYSFEVDQERIRAKGPGFSGGVGLRVLKGSLFFNLVGGWERRDVRISPFREEVKVRGRLEGPFVSADAGFTGDQSRVYLVASYSFATTYLWSRVRFLRNLSEDLSLGGEVVAHGNEDYRAVQTGAVGEVGFGPLRVTLKAGYKRDSVGDRVYGGLETYLEF
ncbi:MAG: cellulose biosynthesis protein BcsS [Aquificota bacterium]|nr:cellulose biosynthesis protein BcsS [Aquificota bacterium]